MLQRKSAKTVKIGELCKLSIESMSNHILNDSERYSIMGNPHKSIYPSPNKIHFADASLFLCVNNSPFGSKKHVSVIPIAYESDSQYRSHHYLQSKKMAVQIIVNKTDLECVYNYDPMISQTRLLDRLSQILKNKSYKKNELERPIELCMEMVNK